MWQYRIESNALVEVDAPVPNPGPGEVLVKMGAASLNARDLGVLAGFYPAGEHIIPLSDGAGTVAECGDGVTTLKPGDQVASCFYPDWDDGPATPDNHRTSLGCEQDGILSEWVCLPETAWIKAPEGYSAAEAATLPCAGLTAWSALFTEGRLQAGQHVVIQGTGGVAVFALQLAKLAGARVSLISSSDDKRTMLETMGADLTINYRTHPDWSEAILQQAGPADLVLELAGGHSFQQSLRCLTVGGRISVIGVAAGPEATVFIPDILFRHAHLNGITVGHRADFAALIRRIEQTDLRPHIHRSYPREQVHQACADMESGGHVGKLVLDLAI